MFVHEVECSRGRRREEEKRKGEGKRKNEARLHKYLRL